MDDSSRLFFSQSFVPPSPSSGIGWSTRVQCTLTGLLRSAQDRSTQSARFDRENRPCQSRPSFPRCTLIRRVELTCTDSTTRERPFRYRGPRIAGPAAAGSGRNTQAVRGEPCSSRRACMTRARISSSSSFNTARVRGWRTRRVSCDGRAKPTSRPQPSEPAPFAALRAGSERGERSALVSPPLVSAARPAKP